MFLGCREPTDTWSRGRADRRLARIGEGGEGHPMSIKRILVPVTGDSLDGDVLEAALKVAKKFDAHTEALFFQIELAKPIVVASSSE
jgi:hypothetical protein